MSASVKQIYDVINEFAPFDTQAAWDNAGILAGDPQSPVDRILVALDMTMGAIEEGKRLGCQLMVTHHPILFHARKNLREDDPEGRALCALIRSGMAHIAAHTNFDQAPGGVSHVLAEKLGLEQVEELEEGLRAGAFKGTLRDLWQKSQQALNTIARPYGKLDEEVRRVAVCGGAGGSLWAIAHQAGCDGYVTGEIHHNDALDAVASGMKLVEAGHYQTEAPSVKELGRALQNRLDELQYNVMVFESTYVPF